ncbi:RNA polymerase sigma factor SigJ [Streptomyces sp. UNOC14_S4]|uniref:RNA polymerase sigma factor SigJ n=1 Tax=Streptomyces sp. UNOC14_S4 TaxID=2872340 RepID=UPI001E6590AD|nr:RNA polymerase sigma factor SigJ [Streptomyces sp. UNOC14_S4]MCC3769979.1 RNA polymerase sigma factor SigJ [Streptomyces sp. UNOC14_S4]
MASKASASTAAEHGELPAHSALTTTVFDEHRNLLFGLVYNMLGTVTDTEDVLQDTWLSWASARHGEVANSRAYLVRIAMNRALRAAKASRRTYVGTWLPEPVVTEDQPEDSVLRGESVSLAMMVVLETLSPMERAVFVLREAFGYDYPEIADTLGRTCGSVRQLAHRARKHVEDRRPRYRPDSKAVRAATERFLDASLGADLGTLMEILAPDVQLWSDGGGKRRSALRVIVGRDKCVRLADSLAKTFPRDLDTRYLEVNGAPAALLSHERRPWVVAQLDLRPSDGRIQRIYQILNPDKLTTMPLPNHLAL